MQPLGGQSQILQRSDSNTDVERGAGDIERKRGQFEFDLNAWIGGGS